MESYAGKIACADIKCYCDKERTDLVAEFKTFPDARKFLGVKRLGESLEKASETGRLAFGYYWRVGPI